MPTYSAPLADLRFAIEHVAGLETSGDFTPDLLEAVLEEAAKFAGGVLAPLNATGDREGAKLENGAVRTATGFKQAYRAFTEAGWNGMPFDPARGGQGLPWLVTFAVQEMLAAANLSFQLCPLLTQAAVEALTHHGSPALQDLYLEKLIAGTWTGTMNLTEPQAGSDLAAVKTRAVPEGDYYRLHGQKIYITYGEHDLAENIIHLVLARTPHAPPGVKGISLFVAPKILPGGARNDLRCVSLEHKLGIHASPTCVMAFGDNEGAQAWLVGEENRGLEYMFTMMNNARLGVGLQGIGVAERAYQAALAYAKERVQGKPLLPGGSTIFYQPDVRRMLLHMKASIEASRGLAYMAGAALDQARAGDSQAQARADLLTPIVKAGSTDMGCEVAALGMQIHGGMGYIEETGAAQFYRDARITPIYEGTNGIQANDLAFRKTARDQGLAAQAFVAEMRGVAEEAAASSETDIASIGRALQKGIAALGPVIDWMAIEGAREPAKAAAGAYAYLRLFHLVAGGFVMAKSALACLSNEAGAADFRAAKRATALYYAQVLMPGAEALATAATVTNQVLAQIQETGF
jgi:alkylation response protein AidB-like acyl-CoA dehydrogenase